jgi:hypothetical protein
MTERGDAMSQRVTVTECIRAAVNLTPLAEQSAQSSKALRSRKNQQHDGDNPNSLFHPSPQTACGQK